MAWATPADLSRCRRENWKYLHDADMTPTGDALVLSGPAYKSSKLLVIVFRTVEASGYYSMQSISQSRGTLYTRLGGKGTCLKGRPSSERKKTPGRENRRARRQVSSCGRRCTMFAKENMERVLASKRSQSASPRRAVPASSCGLLAKGRHRRKPRHKLAVIIKRDRVARRASRRANAPAPVRLL